MCPPAPWQAHSCPPGPTHGAIFEYILKTMRKPNLVLNWGTLQSGIAGSRLPAMRQPQVSFLNRGRLMQRFFLVYLYPLFVLSAEL